MKKTTILAFSMLAPVAVLTACGPTDAEQQVQPIVTVEDDGQTQAPAETTTETTQDTTAEGAETVKSPEEITKETLDKQEKEIKALTNEVEYYRTFVKNFTASFTSEQMAKFVDEEWSYKLAISGISFPKNGVLELSNTSFDLSLTEERVPYSVIPDEMSKEGKVSESITNQVTFKANDVSPKTKEALDETESEIVYSFADVPSGISIDIQITEALQKELGLDTKDLKIQVK